MLGFRIQDAGCGIRDAGYAIRDTGLRIRDWGFGISDEGFAIMICECSIACLAERSGGSRRSATGCGAWRAGRDQTTTSHVSRWIAPSSWAAISSTPPGPTATA